MRVVTCFSPKLTKTSSIRDRLLQGGVEKNYTNSTQKKKGGGSANAPALCEVCLRLSNPALLPAFSHQGPSNDCPCACFARFWLSDGCLRSFQARPVMWTRRELSSSAMGAIHKMAPVEVCGALLHTGPCWMYGWLHAAEKNSPLES